MAAFGTPDKVHEDAKDDLDQMRPDLRQVLVKVGLHHVAALVPRHGLISALIKHGITDVKEFCYMDPQFPEEAVADALGHPKSASMSAYVTGLGGDLSWVNGGQQLQADVRAVVGRMLRAYADAFKADRKGPVSGAGIDADEMDSGTAESISATFRSVYGHKVLVGRLASKSICNSIHRQLSTGMVVDDLKTMIAREDVRSGRPTMETDIVSGTQQIKNVQKKGIGDTETFLDRLNVYLDTLVFVAVVHPAPATEWRGDPEVGVMRGVRYQFTRMDADAYFKFWSKHARKFSSNISALVEMESQVRSQWVTMCGTQQKTVAVAAAESVEKHGHRAEGWKPARPRDEDAHGSPWKRGKHGDGKGGGKGGAQEWQQGYSGGKGKGKGAVDVSKLPGFVPGFRPFTGEFEGKRFCPFFNRGAECWNAANCPKWHRCDVILQSGQPCNSQDHSRQGHADAVRQAGV